MDVFSTDGELRREFLATDVRDIRANFLTVAIAPHNWIYDENVTPCERLPRAMYDYGESTIECPIEGCNVVFHGLRALNCHLRQSKQPSHGIHNPLEKLCVCSQNARVAAHTLAADILV